jgi:hypothetical protein
MSRSRSGPKQVVTYTAVTDPSGMHRLSRVVGFWGWVARLGFGVMTIGLGVFGFMLISTFGSVGSGSVPKMPPGLPIGFGIAIAGGLAFQLGIGLAAQKPEDHGTVNYYDHSDDHRNGIDARFQNDGELTMRDYRPSLVINNQLTQIDRLDRDVSSARIGQRDKQEAQALIQELRQAVASGANDRQVGSSLAKVTNFLAKVGALTGGATAVFASLLQLAGMLGSAGQAAYEWLDNRRR